MNIRSSFDSTQNEIIYTPLLSFHNDRGNASSATVAAIQYYNIDALERFCIFTLNHLVSNSFDCSLALSLCECP